MSKMKTEKSLYGLITLFFFIGLTTSVNAQDVVVSKNDSVGSSTTSQNSIILNMQECRTLALDNNTT